jgi:hypothetical protein
MWEAFWDGVFEALSGTTKIAVIGFFVFWGLYALVGMNMFSFILGHVFVFAYSAYVFRWFRDWD